MADFRLQPLVKFAEERSESAAQDLQRSRALLTQAEDKLRQLEGYLDDYRARLASSTANGITVQAMLDFQHFITKLETAIRTQAGEIGKCRQGWERAQANWLEREREVKAYHALRERHEREEQRKENRRDQRLQDESAQNNQRRRATEDGSQK